MSIRTDSAGEGTPPETGKYRYIPGVCNLGESETRMRTIAGWGCLSLTIVGWAACVYMGVPAPWRLLVALPATGTWLSGLQARWHFCVHYGLLGVFNMGDDVGKADTVEQAEYRRMDQQKALKIIALACLGGTATGVLAWLL